MSTDASTLSIVSYPAEVLRKRALPVERVDDEVRAVAQRMVELMREAEGIGLAAPQVGLPWRMFVVEVPPDTEGERAADTSPRSATLGPMVFINPTLARFTGAPTPLEEGCLSLPDIRGDVLRPPEILVRATDIEGKEFELHAAGLLARCIQHEYDHLDGVLIIDRFTQSSRLKTRSALRELERSATPRNEIM